MAKNQITGGAFQDFEGNRLAYGFITMQLSHDEMGSVDPGQVVGGVPVSIPLDSKGNIAGTVLIWPNNQLTPANSFYIVNAFRQDGSPAWLSPQQFTIPTSPSPYDLGTAIPTLPPVPGVGLGNLTLQTNEVNNASQVLLDLHAGSGVTLTDNLAGRVTIATASGLTLQTNGTPNGSQTLLNLIPGTSIGIVDNGAGGVTISNTGGGGGILGLWPGNWVYFSTAGSNTGSTWTTSAFGMNPAQIGGAFPVTIRPPTSTQPRAARIQASGLTNCSGIEDNVADITPGLLRDWFMKAAVVGKTFSRYWIGLTDSLIGSTPTVMNNDAPAANVIGFRWSSTTDVNFKAVCQTGAANQTIVDTGIAVVSGTPHTFEIVPQGGGTSHKFYIDGAQVANIATNIPGAGTQMFSCFTVDAKTQATSDFNLDFYYCYALLTS